MKEILTVIVIILLIAFPLCLVVWAGLDAADGKVINVATPTGANDAANKQYVDDNDASRATTFVVAANDSSDITKAQADYVCDGTADDVQINAAIAALPDDGGSVVLSEGLFTISNPISIDRGVRLAGQAGQLTKVKLANSANCNMIEFGVAHDDATYALSIVERMELDGNEDNQTTTPVIVTDATGTDANPSVITKSGTYSGFDPNGLAGRKVYLAGTNCTAGLYTIASNDANTLTLGSNASSGGAMSSLTVEAEPLYGIYQKVGNSAIDIRMLDIWFENIEGGGISLGKYWNHQISKCTFEHLEGPAITLRLTDVAPSLLHIDNNFSLSVKGFIKTFGVGDSVSTVEVKVSNNHIHSIDRNIIEIGGRDWIISGNRITAKFATDNIYSVFSGDADKVPDSHMNDISIVNNRLTISGSNYAKHIVHTKGTNTSTRVIIANNSFNSSDKTTTICVENVAQCDNWTISGNYMRSYAGDVIEMTNMNNVIVTGNQFVAASGKHEMVWNTSLRNVVFVGNKISRGFTGSYRSYAMGYPPRIEDNTGVDETATGTVTLQPFEVSYLDSSGGAVTATLPDGLIVGQIKTIVMTDDTNPSTVSATHHETSDPEVLTFSADDETWALMWGGTEWVTLKGYEIGGIANFGGDVNVAGDLGVTGDVTGANLNVANWDTAYGWGDHTSGSYQAQGDILDDLNTLGVVASDGQFIVAAGAGAFAYEATTTARTSLGIGEGDSPTLTGLTLSTLIFDFDTQDYLITSNPDKDAFVIQSQNSDHWFSMHLDSKDGDGTDGVYFNLLGVGTPEDMNDGEGITLAYLPGSHTPNPLETPIFALFTDKQDNGTVHPLYLSTKDNPSQLVLGIDGNISMSGDLEVAGTIAMSGDLGVTGDVTIGSDTLTIETTKTPVSASDTGTKGDHCWDENFEYRCVATNTWKRAELATWSTDNTMLYEDGNKMLYENGDMMIYD